MSNKKVPLKFQLLDLAYKLSQEVEKSKMRKDSLAGGMYTSEASEEEDYVLKGSIAILDTEIFTPLTARACKLLISIIREMQQNNVFWLSGETDANKRRCIAELKRHSILLSTEQKGLFIINPFKLRRGKPMASVMASLRHLDQEGAILYLENLTPPKRAPILKIEDSKSLQLKVI